MSISEYEIVIVEDDPNDMELILRSLKKNRLANRLITLEDGEQALDYFFKRGSYAGREGSNCPKVILLDLKLPKVNGLEVLKELKSDERTRHIPVVVVTSSKENPDIESAYRLGANSYVVKPVEFEGFVETIRNLGLYWMLINENQDSR